ncbi:hypothetical protein [Streptomyces sp. NBC_01538]|uniref:hypothetical protein n=1 Tax=Streptomyces sp. NBC_01538 TaxID=2903897 RepID=UPI003870E94F
MEFTRTSVRRRRKGRLRRTGLIAGASAMLLAAGTAAAPGASGAGDARGTGSVSPRVAALIARMSLDEKLSFVHGGTDPRKLGQAGYIPGVPRLGIPELRLTDGSAGVRVNAHATAIPPTPGCSAPGTGRCGSAPRRGRSPCTAGSTSRTDRTARTVNRVPSRV